MNRLDFFILDIEVHISLHDDIPSTRLPPISLDTPKDNSELFYFYLKKDRRI